MIGRTGELFTNQVEVGESHNLSIRYNGSFFASLKFMGPVHLEGVKRQGLIFAGVGVHELDIREISIDLPRVRVETKGARSASGCNREEREYRAPCTY